MLFSPPRLWACSPVGPGGDAEQIDREADLPVAHGPAGVRAGQVEFVAGFQLQSVIEGAHHSHGKASEHLLQNLIRQILAHPGPGGLLSQPSCSDRPDEKEQEKDAAETRHHYARRRRAKVRGKK